MGYKFNPFTGSLDIAGSSTPTGSDTQVQFNDAGAFSGDPSLVFDKTNDSLNVQSTFKQHPFHANASTGQTLNDVSVASVVQTTETLDASPTGAVDLIAEFAAPVGSSPSQNTSGSGYNAIGQTIDYQVYAVILIDGTYYRSASFESVSFTDAINDNSPFSVVITLPVALSEQTHFYIAKQVGGAGFNDSVLHAIGSSYEDTNFLGNASATSWPTQYLLNYNVPSAPSAATGQEINIGFGNLTENGTTYQFEIRSAANVSGTYYCEQTGTSGSFLDANAAQTFDLQVDWTPGAGDDQFIRISIDAGASWTYLQVGSMGGSFIYTGQANDSTAQTAWGNDISSVNRSFAFKCFGRTLSPSSAGYVYSQVANTYMGTITTPSVNYIFKHNFTGLPAGGGKILADYNVSVSNGKTVTGSFYDVGYSTWAEGISVTPNHFGYTGTAQVREYKLYGYSSSLLIYSVTAYTVASADTGGYKYNTISFSFPSGVTIVKITRGINGAAHNAAAIITSPTASIIDEALSTSWNQTTTVSPNVAVPSTARFDHQRTAIGQVTDNVLICETTGSGERFPSIAFGVAASANTGHTTTLSRIVANSSTGRLQVGAAGIQGYNSSTLTTPSYNIGHSNDFNLVKSSSIHTTIWGADATHPMMYAFSAGDSSRGTVYFGQNSTAYGSSSKVVIAPSAGGTIGLHFRRTNNFTGNCILIDEAGSFKAGWGQSGRMFLNSTAVSTSTFLLIGGVSSGSQLRLAASTTTATVEGDVWNDGTQKCLASYTNSVKQFANNTMFTQTASGTCANTVVETTISSTGIGTLVLPTNFLVAGKTLKIKAFGFHSSVSNPNLTIKVKLGSTVVCTTGAHAVHNGTNSALEIEAIITCRSTGGAGTLFAQGSVYDGTDNIPMVNTATTTIATNASQTMTITAQWGTASASNTITLTNFIVEVVA